MEKWARSLVGSDAAAKELAAKFDERGMDQPKAKKWYDWARSLTGSSQKACDLVWRFDDQSFTLDDAQDMFKWARSLVGSNEKAWELVLEFDAKLIPNDYVKTQYKWARGLVGSADKALDLVRRTHGHPFGPMPFWYTRDMFQFARSKVGSNEKALDLVFEWYGIVEIDGDGWLIWWQLPSFEELAKDIPKFYAEIRSHCGNSEKALDLTARLIRMAGRCDLNEFKGIFRECRKKVANNADALEATFKELESRDAPSKP